SRHLSPLAWLINLRSFYAPRPGQILMQGVAGGTAWSRRDGDAAPAAGARVEREKPVGEQRCRTREYADRVRSLQRAREDDDRPEHAGLLAGRDLVSRRRLLEEAPVAGGLAGHDREQLRARADGPGMDERDAARHR